jgi:CoA:oxalate CoA-transferase
MNRGALDGITVLDLTRILAGPYCGMLLADMGASVIKIERPKIGDDSRMNYPMKDGESYYYMNLNRNKRGITLDLKSEDGKEIFRSLVKKADVVIENYRPGVMDRLGLGYEELIKINPALVYGCVSGFGHYGPYKDRPGYDIIGQAMGGLMSTTGWPETGPTRSGTAISDVMGGISMCVGVLAAYISRLQTGKGQKVDVSLVDSVVSALEFINQIYLATGRIPERIGNRYEAGFPYDSFHAKDGDLVFAAANDKLFAVLTKLMGKPELKDDPRFCSNILRVQNHAELKSMIEEWTINYTIDETVNTLLGVGIPAGPIYNIAQVVADPHIAGAREMFVEMEHPVVGKMKVTGNQIKMSETPVRFDLPAPTLGQHTREVLSEMIGLTEEKYLELLGKDVF